MCIRDRYYIAECVRADAHTAREAVPIFGDYSARQSCVTFWFIEDVLPLPHVLDYLNGIHARYLITTQGGGGINTGLEAAKFLIRPGNIQVGIELTAGDFISAVRSDCCGLLRIYYCINQCYNKMTFIVG